MDGELSPWEKGPVVEDNQKLVENLSNYDAEDPRIQAFAKFMGSRIRQQVTVNPQSFVTAAYLCAEDLEKEIDGFSRMPFKNDISGLASKDYDEILKKLPEVAGSTVSKEFGEAVAARLSQLEEIRARLYGPEESMVGKDLTEGEIITQDITNIDEAYENIVLDAKARLLDLDWEGEGVSKEHAAENYDGLYLLALRQSKYHLPLNTLLDHTEHEESLLAATPDSQKMHISDIYWLWMQSAVIPADKATFTRDFLFIMSTELVAITTSVDKARIGFKDKNLRSPIARAAIRLHTYAEDHPELDKDRRT